MVQQSDSASLNYLLSTFITFSVPLITLEIAQKCCD